MRDKSSDFPISEAELHGFVDGGLERSRYAAVQAFLAASPANAARVETWQRQNEIIRAAFASMKVAPLPLSFAESSGAAQAAFPGGWRSEASSRLNEWRAWWSLRLIAAAFLGGALLMAGVTSLITRINAPTVEDRGATLTAADANSFAARSAAALRLFNPPLDAAPVGKGGPREPELAVPVLPSLPIKGLKLTGVRAMPDEHGEMLCLFYTKPDASKLGLCAEKTPGPNEAKPLYSGSNSSGSVTWRQNGAAYALTGALPEPDLRALAEAVSADIAAFGIK